MAAAEIAALAIGLGLCPLGAEAVIAHTDLVWLPDYLAGRHPVSYETVIAPAVRALKAAAVPFQRVEWRVVDRMHSLYKECHKCARLQAIAAAKRRETFGRIREVRERQPGEPKVT